MTGVSSVRIELNRDGIRELLRSPEVAADLARRGRAVQQAAQHRDLMVDGDPGETALPVTVANAVGARARTRVITDHPSGLAVELKHRLLVGSLDAAR